MQIYIHGLYLGLALYFSWTALVKLCNSLIMRRRNKPKAFKKQRRSPISIQANLHTAKLQETGFSVCGVKIHHRSLSRGQRVWDPAHTQERSEQRLLRAQGERGPGCDVAAPVSLCHWPGVRSWLYRPPNLPLGHSPAPNIFLKTSQSYSCFAQFLPCPPHCTKNKSQNPCKGPHIVWPCCVWPHLLLPSHAPATLTSLFQDAKWEPTWGSHSWITFPQIFPDLIFPFLRPWLKCPLITGVAPESPS